MASLEKKQLVLNISLSLEFVLVKDLLEFSGNWDGFKNTDVFFKQHTSKLIFLYFNLIRRRKK